MKPKVQIKCLHCGSWFDSPFYFSDGETFDSSTLIDNSVQCPSCGKMTDCNKENMRAIFPDGGFVGDETI